MNRILIVAIKWEQASLCLLFSVLLNQWHPLIQIWWDFCFLLIFFVYNTLLLIYSKVLSNLPTRSDHPNGSTTIPSNGFLWILRHLEIRTNLFIENLNLILIFFFKFIVSFLLFSSLSINFQHWMKCMYYYQNETTNEIPHQKWNKLNKLSKERAINWNSKSEEIET